MIDPCQGRVARSAPPRTRPAPAACQQGYLDEARKRNAQVLIWINMI